VENAARLPLMSGGKGSFVDLLTQRWVKLTGRHTTRAQTPWLEGPIGDPLRIGSDFFDRWAARAGYEVQRDGPPRGLLPDFGRLAGPTFRPELVHRDVRSFYEQTSEYELEAWSEWCGAFRPFGWILARVFSRRLQQLNVPLQPLDTSHGTESEVLHLRHPSTGAVAMAAWVRHLRRTGDVLYAGSYSVAQVPGHADPCVRVVFPLPNGNAIVLLKPIAEEDGALTVLSEGRTYGEPGFYFTVEDGADRLWMRYVRSMRESIRVYAAGGGDVRADHVMWFFGLTFLRLHYRLRRRPARQLAEGPA